MDILEVIDQLEEKIEKAFNIPVLNKCMIDKEDLLADVEDIRLQLPEELKQAPLAERGAQAHFGRGQSRCRRNCEKGRGKNPCS